jgi:hypothetical protein
VRPEKQTAMHNHLPPRMTTHHKYFCVPASCNEPQTARYPGIFALFRPGNGIERRQEAVQVVDISSGVCISLVIRTPHHMNLQVQAVLVQNTYNQYDITNALSDAHLQGCAFSAIVV